MRTHLRGQLATWSSAIGAIVAAISCTAMIAATVVGLFGVIGLRASAEFANTFNDFLSPTAQPLLIASLALIVIGMTPRRWMPVAFAVTGSVLVYLAMFILPSGASGMTGMAAMSVVSTDPFSLGVFWLGVAVLAAAFLVAYRR